ncbi:cupin domain-containing protein [Leptolyngbya sp. FACHB-261]|uniref:cupin domain-containing protein n=1 Tax=Leptolyngbya sp. FACHB-261 TaxID=2692806 RepID=UPI0016848D7C|nr:cupin domain-containing protein [Leptolyngbya sp. FACHB-261]MBD2103344.1 cupin domain-containing protein [Leptolyngbya sp. FACHB-261]
MTSSNFPERIKSLPRFSGRFDAFRLAAENCEIFFAQYPGNTEIEPHHHDTDNYGVITQGELILVMDGQEQRFQVGDWYHVPAKAMHAARFEQFTAEIEFWFKPDLQELDQNPDHK